MDSQPLISIVITTFNRAFLLERCIQSVLAQPYSPIEVILVDDASTDDTKYVAGKYAEQIRYIRKEHGGIAATRNVGCRAAKGDYIAFVDDDDLMHPNRLPGLVEALSVHPGCVCVFSQGSLIDQGGNDTGVKCFNDEKWPQGTAIIDEAYEQMVAADITVTPWSSLILRTAGESVGWFDENFKHGCEDTDFFMRLSRAGAFVCVPRALTWVRQGERVSLTRDEVRMAYSKLQLLEKHVLINRKRGRRDLILQLQDRQYHFLKLILLSTQNTSELQEQFGVNMNRMLFRLGVRRVFYLLYLRYVKSRLNKEGC